MGQLIVPPYQVVETWLGLRAWAVVSRQAWQLLTRCYVCLLPVHLKCRRRESELRAMASGRAQPRGAAICFFLP